jgi:hypothetical protein
MDSDTNLAAIRARAKNAKTNADQPDETTWPGHCWAGAIRDREWMLVWMDQALDLLQGAQTHLLDGDNSMWRKRLDAFVRSQSDAGTSGEVKS